MVGSNNSRLRRIGGLTFLWVAVSDYGTLMKALESDSPKLYEVARVPQESTAYALIVSYAP